MFRNMFGDDLFDDFFDSFSQPLHRLPALESKQNYLMRTDIKETEKGFDLDIELPGYKKEDVKAELKDGYLTITAVTTSEKEEKNKSKFVRRERFYGSCSRAFYVGEELTEEDIKAKFEDGILKLSIPKKEVQKQIETPKYISIE